MSRAEPISAGKTNKRSALPVLGWREWLCLPDIGLVAVRAKVDTGARSSALHVDSYEEFTEGDVQRVRFVVRPDQGSEARTCVADILDRRDVTDSSGHRSRRVFIRTRLVVKDQEYPIEVNLTSRHQMLFPMLLGRTAIAGRWLVDPARSFVQGRVAG